MERLVTAWMDAALCAQTDPDAFVPDDGSHGYKDARKVCVKCPVIADCLQWALDTREPDGMYGGLSPKQRRKLWR